MREKQQGQTPVWPILLVATGVVVVGVGLFPVIAAGTIDPCEASVRVAMRRMPRPSNDDGGAMAALGNMFAVRVGTEMVREKFGTVGCYRALGHALAKDLPSGVK